MTTTGPACRPLRWGDQQWSPKPNLANQHAAAEAQGRVKREGKPEMFSAYYREQCRLRGVGGDAASFDRKGRRGRELLGRVLASLRRQDRDLAAEFGQTHRQPLADTLGPRAESPADRGLTSTPAVVL